MKTKRVHLRTIVLLIVFITYFAHVIPFILSASTGIPFREITTAGSNPNWNIDEIFTYFDWALAVLYVFAPAFGLFVAGFIRGKWGFVSLFIGTVLSVVFIFVFRIHTSAVDFVPYLVLYGLAIMIPTVSRGIGFIYYRKTGKYLGASAKLKILFGTIGIAIAVVTVIAIIQMIIAMLATLFLLMSMALAFGILMTTACYEEECCACKKKDCKKKR